MNIVKTLLSWLKAKITAPKPLVRLTFQDPTGNRTYELVPILKRGEVRVGNEIMLARARKHGANSGQDDGQFFLAHQQQIPDDLRGEALVFAGWHDPQKPGSILYLHHLHNFGKTIPDGWYLSWSNPIPGWRWEEDGRLVRRVA